MEQLNRELMVLRHAKSDWSHDVDDFNRPITRKGRKAAKRLGRWLNLQNLLPDLIIASPAVRAWTTMELVREAFEQAAAPRSSLPTIAEERIYETSYPTLLSVLAECPASANRVLLVGHNPGLEYLVTYLAGPVPVPPSGKIMATAVLWHLKMPRDWRGLARASATAVQYCDGKLLNKSGEEEATS